MYSRKEDEGGQYCGISDIMSYELTLYPMLLTI
jgi:hypothetical protein